MAAKSARARRAPTARTCPVRSPRPSATRWPRSNSRSHSRRRPRAGPTTSCPRSRTRASRISSRTKTARASTPESVRRSTSRRAPARTTRWAATRCRSPSGTNSSVVGGFDAPSARGMWDRSTLFSNGIFSSQEVLQGAQDCADGLRAGPEDLRRQPRRGARSRSRSPAIPATCALPRSNCSCSRSRSCRSRRYETIWDPAVGMTERGSFVATFEGLFALVYGVRGDAIWQYQLEFGTGLPGLTGRQVSIDPANPDDPGHGRAARPDRALRHRGSRHGGGPGPPPRRDALRPGDRGVAERQRLVPVDGGAARAGPRRWGAPSPSPPTYPRTCRSAVPTGSRCWTSIPTRARPRVTGDAPTLPRPIENTVATVPARRRVRGSGRDGAGRRRPLRGLLVHAGHDPVARGRCDRHDDRPGPRPRRARGAGPEPERLPQQRDADLRDQRGVRPPAAAGERGILPACRHVRGDRQHAALRGRDRAGGLRLRPRRRRHGPLLRAQCQQPALLDDGLLLPRIDLRRRRARRAAARRSSTRFGPPGRDGASHHARGA